MELDNRSCKNLLDDDECSILEEESGVGYPVTPNESWVRRNSTIIVIHLTALFLYCLVTAVIASLIARGASKACAGKSLLTYCMSVLVALQVQGLMDLSSSCG